MNRVKNNYEDIARARAAIIREEGEHPGLKNFLQTLAVFGVIWLAWIMLDGIVLALGEMFK